MQGKLQPKQLYLKSETVYDLDAMQSERPTENVSLFS